MKKTIKNIDFFLERSGPVFTIDDEPAFRMNVSRFLTLIDPVFLRTFYDNNTGDEWAGLDNLRNFALVQRLLKKGLNFTEIGTIFATEESRLRRFYNYGLQKYGEPGVGAECQRYETEDFVKSLKVDTEHLGGQPFQELLNLRQIKIQMQNGQSPETIAKERLLDLASFNEWLRLNESYLDAIKI